MKDLVDGDDFHVYMVHKVDELKEELPAPSSLLPWSGPVDESGVLMMRGLWIMIQILNGGDTNHNEAESNLLSSD